MRKLDNMDWAEASLPQEVCPILLGVLVIDSVLKVIWQKVFKLNWGREADLYVRVYAKGLSEGGLATSVKTAYLQSGFDLS